MSGEDGVPKRLPERCIEDKDRHGNIRVYYRTKDRRKKIRLLGMPWSEPFLEAYRSAVAADEAGPIVPAPDPNAPPPRRPPATKDTWRWLCVAYFDAPEFKTQLDDRTKIVRRRILELTFDEPIKPGSHLIFGNMPLVRMGTKAVRALRDRRADKREAANARLKAIRQVFAYGLAAELYDANPARDVPYFGGQTDGFHTWTVEEVGQYIAKHPIGTKAYLALCLLLFIGCRRADVVQFGPQHLRNAWLKYTQHKNRKRKKVTLELPVLPPLQAAIAAMPPRPTGHELVLTFLVTEWGKPFTSNGFGNWFKKRCVEAKLPHCSAHGLRKAGASIAAENGATEPQLMAMYGWSNPKQAALYIRKARQKKLAGSAMHLINLDEIGTALVPPNTRLETGSGPTAVKSEA